MQQFKKFCLIGGGGFIVDSLCFIFFSHLTNNIMLARLLSFWVAATVTWLGNRIYTYKQHQNNAFYQWCKHMLTAHFSGCINLLVFWSVKGITITAVAFVIGIFVSLFINFFLANRFVFVTTHSK
ncbi:GtrA family protein [Pseudoalteromonas sp. H105]|jgi:putative flippase GtrA|uniref:GtrA family protein n=1 Tax=Pseudoalteromonas sp. H105 TaxID=1348393 RepID=UPI00073225B2|nr:GtrA family protein [Pseudoalteromonas sp. H105]KTF16918.1 hypothetical protein ATS75_05600 [Pseudoalteromonas sp. H105]